jgi:DNA-binding transcriptional regulator YiaG
MNELNSLSEIEKLEADNLEIQKYFRKIVKQNKSVMPHQKRTSQKKSNPKESIKSKAEPIIPNLFSNGKEIEVEQKKTNMNEIVILKLRNDLKLTQKEFGNLIGVDRRTVINYEQGRKIPISKTKQIEQLIENGIPKKQDVPMRKHTTSPTNAQMENLNREILDLKDHIKTLKDFLDEKNKLTDMYKIENTLLKERINLLNQKD